MFNEKGERVDELTNIEKAFELSALKLKHAEEMFEIVMAKYHLEIYARKLAGEKLTVPDIDALKIAARDNVPYVKEAYLKRCQAEIDHLDPKVTWEAKKREYWESRGK